MKTRYRHIEFIEKPGGLSVERIFLCKNIKSDGLLGKVYYYRRWRRFVIEFLPGCVFDHNCIADIKHFLGQLND